jgi:hypothetical protein
MSTEITAKIVCSKKEPIGTSGEFSLNFNADYADGRNKKWASATPVLSLGMTVKGSVSDSFEVGNKYTLTFVREED